MILLLYLIGTELQKEIQDALNNSREYVRHYSKKTIKYFTDIPFCGDITGEKDFY